MANRIEDRIKRIDGVGSIQSFGSGYAMRIWLDPRRSTNTSSRPPT